MKVGIIAGIIAAAFIIISPKPDTFDLYPETMQIVEVNHENDLVTGQTATGDLFRWFGAEGWNVGDFASCLMNDNKTLDTAVDDIVVDARYCAF